MAIFVSSAILTVFENQFSRERGRLVFRRYSKGPAYQLDQEQRERFVTRFIWQQRALFGGMLIVLMALIFAVFPIIEARNDKGPEATLWLFFVPFALIMAGVLYLNHRAITAPEKELSAQLAVSPELSREARKELLFQKLSYGQLALAPVFGLFVVWSMSDNFDVTQGWGRLIWFVPIGFLILALVQAIRKFRFERHSD